MNEFEWDSHNMRHILDDYPERGNSISEVESIFSDPFVIYRINSGISTEQRYRAIGLSNSGRIKVVIFTVNSSKIRPISCWEANTQTKRVYYERAKN